MSALGRIGRIGHALRRTVLVADLDKITSSDAEFRHVLAVHFDERIRKPVLDEVVVLIEELILPEDVGTHIVDPELVVLFLARLSSSLPASPSDRTEQGFLVLSAMPGKVAVGIEPLGADEFAVGKACDGFLYPVVAHRTQTLVGDFRIALVAVHEGVFLGLPVIPLELVRIGCVSHFPKNSPCSGPAGRDRRMESGCKHRLNKPLAPIGDSAGI